MRPSSRSRARLTFPVSECGSAVRKCTDVGTLYRAVPGGVLLELLERHVLARAPDDDRPDGGPGLRSGTPMTALSAIAGWASSTRSTSAG